MNTELLKSKLLEAAIQGKLVPQDPNDEPASALLSRLRKERGDKIKAGIIRLSKPEKALKTEITNDFDLPSSWIWCVLNDVCRAFGRIGFRGYTKEDLVSSREQGAISISPSNMENLRLNYNRCTYITEAKYLESPEIMVENGDILLTKTASVGKLALVENLPWKATINPQIAVLKEISIDRKFLTYVLASPYIQEVIHGFTIGTSIPTYSQEKMLGINIPLPPLAEQHRIVATLEEGFAAIDAIAEAKENLSSTAEMLRSKILQAAFDGSLTGADFTKSLVQLGNVCDIARGGSPRPIKQYITTAANGVNWIKIGDTDKGGKYINSCKEKIIPEGVSRSRMVHEGDFLLTNSMSFGRPYITNIDGCIHDGWLVISPHDNTFDKDFLFYLLSSSYVYAQFCDKATGSTVSNLNIDRVKATLVPMPSITEQQRIVAKIEELFAEIDKLTK